MLCPSLQEKKKDFKSLDERGYRNLDSGHPILRVSMVNTGKISLKEEIVFCSPGSILTEFILGLWR